MTTVPEHRWFGLPPLFDPDAGTVVLEPEEAGAGWWVGAPSAIYDLDRRMFYLYYRQRRPLGAGRGWRIGVAESKDGVSFTEIWYATKEQFGSSSIERSCIVKTPGGGYRLYVSYVEMPRNRWRIDVLEASDPRGWDAARRVPILDPDGIDSEGVKDPVVFLVGGLYFMLVPYAPRTPAVRGSTEKELHGTGNVFTVSCVKHPSGLAVSGDGIHFRWLGDVIVPGEGWDRQMARAASVLYMPPVFNVFYDGRTGEGDIYEDKTGLYITLDLQTFHKVTEAAPLLQSRHGEHCVRYLDTVQHDGRVYYYYEYGRPDGAHDLRVSIVSL